MAHLVKRTNSVRNDRFSGLSDGQLLTQLEKLTRKERATTLEILLHLIEVERRKLHLTEGYTSLFEYCRKRLGYSESAANRRICAARCIGDHEEVYDLLLKNQLSLSTVSLVAGVLTKENKHEVLIGVVGKSRREVEAVIATCRPKKVIRDRITAVSLQKPGKERDRSMSESRLDGAREAESGQGSIGVASTGSGGISKQKWQDFDRRRGGKNPATDAVLEMFKIQFATAFGTGQCR